MEQIYLYFFFYVNNGYILINTKGDLKKVLVMNETNIIVCTFYEYITTVTSITSMSNNIAGCAKTTDTCAIY